MKSLLLSLLVLGSAYAETIDFDSVLRDVCQNNKTRVVHGVELKAEDWDDLMSLDMNKQVLLIFSVGSEIKEAQSAPALSLVELEQRIVRCREDFAKMGAKVLFGLGVYKGYDSELLDSVIQLSAKLDLKKIVFPVIAGCCPEDKSDLVQTLPRPLLNNSSIQFITEEMPIPDPPKFEE